jgi:hypothetical protein
MDSQHSDIFDLVARIEESARRGNWKNVRALAAILPQQTLPTMHEELGEYLRRLKEALIVAKVSRANSAASLVRLNAAARFNNTRLDFAPLRQKPGEAADS